MRLVLFSLLAILSASAAGEIYRYTDADGNTVFTDRPPAGKASPVELPPANTVELRVPEPEVRAQAAPAQKQQQAQLPYRVLRIAGLPQGEALRANSGAFTVSAQLDPPLREGHLLRFLLDGEPVAGASSATILELQNVSRGPHSLQLEILAGERVVQRSAIEQFSVQRVSVSPAQRPRPAP